MFKILHDWDLDPKSAIAVQKELAQQIILEDRFEVPHTIAGIDAGYENNGSVTRAAIVVLRLEDLEPLDYTVVRRPTTMPYIPGLLSFRELPAVLEALEKLNVMPDVIACDGNGLIHPRRFGLACHLGLITDRPCFGVAKNKYIGEFQQPDREKGSRSDLIHKNEVIGAVLRTRTGVKPVFVSAGHNISLDTAVAMTRHAARGYRLPETTRLSDWLSSGEIPENLDEFNRLAPRKTK